MNATDEDNYLHIMVPVAFDEEHDPARAVAVARMLCGATTRVSLVHVMEQVPGYAVNYIPEGFEAEAEKAIVDSLRAMGADLPDARGVVIRGHAAKSILTWAGGNDVDCIVIASHKPDVQDILLGSTAAQVVRQANCSVHVVR